MHSQHGEDDLIFKYIPKKENGIYIEIGAGDPKEISNTFMLYQTGWKGLLIEPNPAYHNKIKETRPKDILLPIAISNYDGEIEMCSTASANTPLWKYYCNPNKIYKVNCLTMDSLIKQYPEFKEPDFVSIDIETGEEKLLSKCNFEIFKPKLILIEYWCRGTDNLGNEIARMDYRPIWEHYLLPYYEFKEIIGGNAFYLRK